MTRELVRPLAVIAPFTNERLREWPLRHHRRLAELLLADRAQYTLMITGATRHRIRGNEIVRGFSAARVINGCGISWQDQMSVLEKCEFVVALNSGISHLAASMGVRTICIFGAAHAWVEWMAVGEHVLTIGKQPPCAPCEVGGGLCPNEMACLDALEPEFVYTQICEFLGSSGQPADHRAAPTRSLDVAASPHAGFPRA